ncbi:hypothetical protein HJ588_09985 [Flexivirga sp. ID2601S]|uniref:Uncharacterized protein n=1 Tax=Flexivirga aerilata TaxID=1656889 RepID=A0A849AK11_9MICO|nr:hypothetical protein [Flexivirga aerilata]NNG39598.1 hypothetical protein [Flexivirga aerilata]
MLSPVGIDEAVALIVAILLVAGALPFAMAWCERTIDREPRQIGPGRGGH